MKSHISICRFLLVLSFLTGVWAAAQAPLPWESLDLEFYNLAGPVREVRVLSFPTDRQEAMSSSHVQFNHDGYVTRRGQGYPGSGSSTNYLNDVDGRILDEEIYLKGERIIRYVYLYDAQGAWKQALGFQNAFMEAHSPTRQILNADIKEAKRRKFPMPTTVYSFDDKGHIVSIKDYGKGERKPVQIQEFKTDTLGCIAEIITTYRDGSVERSALISNVYCHVLESISYNASGTPEKRTTYAYTYDKHGNLLTWKMFDTRDELISEKRYDYAYDEHGNWDRKFVWERNASEIEFEHTLTDLRFIDYYE